MSEWKKLKREFYRKDTLLKYHGGIINFSPESINSVENGTFKSYDEYLEVQERSCGKIRTYFEMSYYYGCSCDFKGQVARVNALDGTVLFKQITIEGFYGDGDGFYGKEDHVWISTEDTSAFQPGESLSFNAEVYRYMKHGGQDGKLIDYGLRDISDIRKIESYEVPTEEELVDQQISQLVCETCLYHDQCSGVSCIANMNERKERIATLKSLEPGKFTFRTVLLAYELQYRMLAQTGGIRLDRNDPHYGVMERFAAICASHPVYYYGDVMEAFDRMVNPDKPRIYIGDTDN